MKHHSARLSYAFMLSLLFLGVEVFSVSILVAPLHRLLEGVGFPAENYVSGLLIAVLPIAAGAAFWFFSRDRLLVPCSFALLFFYTVVLIVLCLFKQEYNMILTLFLPTLGVCSIAGNLLYWGMYYAGKK